MRGISNKGETSGSLKDIDTIDDLNSYRLNRSATAYATNKWIENDGAI